MSFRRFAAEDKNGIRVEYIRLFKPEITEFKRMGGNKVPKLQAIMIFFLV
jgi:hypothetical protein